MDNSEHISRLRKIRNDRCAERRELAAQYRKAKEPLEIVEKIVFLQEQIDALDRAIADEQRIEKSRPGAPDKPLISDEAAIGDDPESHGDSYTGSAK